MAIPVTQVRRGNVVDIDGTPYKVLDHHLNTPGNKGGIVTFKLRNLETGANVQKRFNSNSSIETIFFSKKSCQYLYPEGSGFVFMDNETYDQFTLGTDILGDMMKYVPLNSDVMVLYLEDRPVDIELPASVTMEVVEAEPAIRGDTATNVTKLCKVETGLEVKVPQHIKVGERISIDTRSGEFLGRAKG
ncbi:MAG: elongation factor P [Planctomycetota bacterium]|nr:MAG: elongation factor P [Planctomycetota bacterium]